MFFTQTATRVRASLFLLLCGLGTTSYAAETAAPGAARLFPQSVYFYTRIDDVDQYRQDLKQTATGRMLSDPKLKPIASEYYLAFEELVSQPLAEALEMSLDQLLSIPHGQLAVAVFPAKASSPAIAPPAPTAAPKDESPEAIRQRLEARRQEVAASKSGDVNALIVVDTGAQAGDMKKLLATLEKELIESGSVKRNKTIDGVEITRLIRPDNDRRAVEFFQRNGTTIIGVGADTAGDALTRWNNQSSGSTLAESVEFATIMSRCIGAEDTRPQVSFFVDPFRIVERAMASGNAALIWPMVESLGVGKLKGVGGSVFQGGEVFEDIGHTHVLLDAPRDGIFSVVRPAKGENNPPKWVPSDVAGYTSLNWRIDKTFDGVERIFDQFSGEGAFAKQVIEPFKQRTELDLREAIVNTTADRMVLLSRVQSPARFNSLTRLIGVQVKDPAKTIETIEELRKTIWKRVETDQIGTYQIYCGPKRNRQMPDTLREPEPCAVMLDDWLLLSDSREFLEQALRANNGSVDQLIALPEYDLVANELGAQLNGEQPFLFSFMRVSESIRQIYELGNSAQIKSLARGQGEASSNPAVKRIAELMDQKELPPFSEFEKYFAPTGIFAYDEPNGIHLGRYTLKAN